MPRDWFEIETGRQRDATALDHLRVLPVYTGRGLLATDRPAAG